MRKIYKYLKIKSKKEAYHWLNGTFTIVISLGLIGVLGYALFTKDVMKSDEKSWDLMMKGIIAFMLLFSIAMLYVAFRKHIKRDWED